MTKGSEGTRAQRTPLGWSLGPGALGGPQKLWDKWSLFCILSISELGWARRGRGGVKLDFKILHLYAPNFEEVDGAYWFQVLRSSRIVHARILKFHILLIPHGKIADTCYFSCPSYLPFWSYAPLKKSEWNLVSKISQKVYELRVWNLVSW